MAYGEGMKRLSPCGNELIAKAIASFSEPESILDVGCGRGERLAYLVQRFPNAAIVGVDIDAENAEIAAQRLPQCAITCADAKNLPYEDRRFDTVLCECAFSLFDEPEICLNEMLRVLQPGGRLVLADLCTGENRATVHKAPDGEAVKMIYSRDALEKIVCGAGFSLISFDDRSGELTDMAAQMLFDGSFCSCVGEQTARLLFKLKVGYGLWIFEKDSEDNV